MGSESARGAVLETVGLVVGVGTTPWLRGIDLRVGPGSRIALVGPSGCGKSTLLRTVATLLEPLDGDLRLDGRSPSDWGHPAWRRAVSYVPQTPRLRGRTVREVLEAPFGFRVSDRPFDEARVAAHLDALGLPAPTLGREPGTLSVGERQRVALARALSLDPAVLLLDEPTAALDAAAVRGAERAIIDTSERAGVLFVTHDPAQSTRLATATVDLEEHRA